MKSEVMYSVVGQGLRREWQARARALIPNGTQTLSKCPERYVEGVYPTFLAKADGFTVTDIDGNDYTDFICALGAVSVGYNHRHVNAMVKAVITDGAGLMSLPSRLEVTLSEVLSNNIPCAKKVKLFKTGSEAMSAAVRVARAFTGKDKVAVCGYHGWHDWYTASTPRALGIPASTGDNVVRFKYNDPESLRQLFIKDDIAAVILEPLIYEEPKDGFLETALKLAHEHSALLVFDEIVTGYRFGLGGAMSRFGVVPDLACFSKAMGNGFPIAALVGFPDPMNVYERPEFFVSGTYGSDGVGIAAALAVTESLKWNDETQLRRIWANGKLLRDGFNDLCNLLGIQEVSCVGQPPRTMFQFPTLAHKALFWQECVRQHVLFGYANFISAAHTASCIESTLGVCEVAMRVVKEHWDDPGAQLEGKLPQEVFPQKQP